MRRILLLLLPFLAALVPPPTGLAQPAKANDEGLALAVLEDFLGNLSVGDFKAAYQFVAPSSIKNGDPIAYKAPLDYESFVKELAPFVKQKTVVQPDGTQVTVVELPKFKNYKTGATRWEGPNRFRVWVTFQEKGTGSVDNDEVLLVRENGKWYVADPIHIIR
jgi:hypothetical protein